MEKNSKIYVAGHTGMVGSAIVRQLLQRGYRNLVLRTHSELDLCAQSAAESFFQREKPEYVFDAAALVGGIGANSAAPADFFYVNMAIANNLITAARKSRVKKLLFLGTACMYPKECPQPMTEDMLLTGLPEVTNEGYALAKICGSRLCSYMNAQYGTDFISAIPANAYGIGDCFDPQKSHVIPALIMKFHNAKINGEKSVALWGTGKPLREFIYADDIGDACVFLMNNYSGSAPVNIGTGEEISISDLARLVKKIVGFAGDIVFDAAKPDGMMRRKLCSDKIRSLGWTAKQDLAAGLERAYKYFLGRGASVRQG